jgi:hypothetical protein
MGRQLFVFLAALLLFVAPAVANAQSGGCDTAPGRAVGGSVARSDPYFEPSPGVSGPGGSVHSGRSLHLAARADLPIAGAWRARVEGGATRWPLERQIYSADLRQVVATETVGHINVRQMIALAGRQGGRAPVCGYVLAGGGLYSLSHGGTRSHHSGVALMLGMEFPGGPRGAVQVDLQIHIINTGEGGRYPIGSTAVIDTRLSAGWMYRF